MFDVAVLGREVDAFLSSNVGKLLLSHAEADFQKSMSKIKSCDPSDFKLIMQLQSDIARAESIQRWLAEAVEAGKTAENLLEDRENE